MANKDTNDTTTATKEEQGTARRGFTSSSTAGTTQKDTSSTDTRPNANAQTQTQAAAANVDRPTAEELRQQAQRDETQEFLDRQEESRQMMAAQTKAREEREKKANQSQRK